MVNADRSLDRLEKSFKIKVVQFLQEVEPMGVFVTEAWRSDMRQRYLRLRGLSKVVTSYHQKGLAIDLAFKDDPRTKQVERELYPSDMKRWREVAAIAKKYEIDWGYDLWNWDKPHFQDNGKPIESKKPEKEVSKWAKDAVKWSSASGIATGWNNPQAPVTKEQMATMLHRFYTKYIIRKKLK